MEFDIYGVYLPGFFALMLVAYLVTLLLRCIAGRIGVYSIVWHRALFDFCIYLLVLSALFTASVKFVR